MKRSSKSFERSATAVSEVFELLTKESKTAARDHLEGEHLAYKRSCQSGATSHAGCALECILTPQSRLHADIKATAMNVTCHDNKRPVIEEVD